MIDPDDIDPEILDVILELNKFDFMKTAYSCAGYGPHSKNDIESSKTWKIKYLSHGTAYLVINWANDHPFKTELEGLCVDYNDDYWKSTNIPYYFTQSKDPTECKLAWDKIRALINKYKSTEAIVEQTVQL